MADNRCYINAMAQVSCQRPLTDEWFESPLRSDDGFARSLEPDTKGIISPSDARRMGKLLKRAIATSVKALNDGGVTAPDAIIIGTGMGCIENSEKFLVDMSRYGESCLQPTPFMQSTHNTISSRIAMHLGCHGYNNTYSHRGISFDSALLDAFVQISAGMIGNALVGAHDEATALSAKLLKQIHPERGFASETSVAMLLDHSRTSTTACEIDGIHILNRPSHQDLRELMADAGNLLLLGVNGKGEYDQDYYGLLDALGRDYQLLHYKHIFGENDSVSAMSVGVAATVLKRQFVPDFLRLSPAVAHDESLGKIAILNCSDRSTWSLIKLKR